MKNKIIKEFPKAPINFSFNDVIHAASWGDEKTNFIEDWSSWDEIPKEIIDVYAYSLICHSSKEDFIWIIPRYLIEMVKECNEYSDVVDIALEILMKKLMAWFSKKIIHLIFKESQIQLIYQCLKWYIINYGEENELEWLDKHSLEFIYPKGSKFLDYKMSSIDSEAEFWLNARKNLIKTWIDLD